MPVDDVAKPMAFHVEGITSGVLRLKPASHFKECWDMLLFVCASAQLFVSLYQFGSIVLLRMLHVLTDGDICTFFWWWCCLTSSMLVLHKKLHARWWVSTHKDHRTAKDQDFVCCGGFWRVPRTPSPVRLLDKAPGVIDRGRAEDDRTARASGPSRVFLKVLRRLRPYAYRRFSQLQEGDAVVIRPRWPWKQRREKVGTLLRGYSDEDGLYEVELADGGTELLLRKDFDLRSDSEVEAAERTWRPGLWHDQLTAALLRTTAVLWALCAVLMFLLPPSVLADSDGYLSLQLVPRTDSGAAQRLFGLVLGIQVSCIMLEWAIRLMTWAVARFLLLFVYAGM